MWLRAVMEADIPLFSFGKFPLNGESRWLCVQTNVYLLLLALKAVALVCVSVCLSVCFIMVCFNSVSGVDCECAFLCRSSL